jgi:hypothetical protein
MNTMSRIGNLKNEYHKKKTIKNEGRQGKAGPYNSESSFFYSFLFCFCFLIYLFFCEDRIHSYLQGGNSAEIDVNGTWPPSCSKAADRSRSERASRQRFFTKLLIFSLIF